jgi:hypothetical protein
MHHQREHLSQSLMFRSLRGQLITVQLATAADTLLLAELLDHLKQ